MGMDSLPSEVELGDESDCLLKYNSSPSFSHASPT